MNLEQLRNQIDAIDENLIDLFCQRQRLCAEIGDYKQKVGLPIFVPEREEEKLSAVSAFAGGEMADYARILYSLIMRLSKSYQNRLNTISNGLYMSILEAANSPLEFHTDDSLATTEAIANCTGVALVQSFPGASVITYKTNSDVIAAVSCGVASYGLLALGQDQGNDIFFTATQLRNNNLYICRSFPGNSSHRELILITNTLCFDSNADRSGFLLTYTNQSHKLMDLTSVARILNIPITKAQILPSEASNDRIDAFIEINSPIFTESFMQFLQQISEICVNTDYLGSYREVESWNSVC